MGINCSTNIDQMKNYGLILQKNQENALQISQRHKLGKQFFSIICRILQSHQEHILDVLQNLINIKQKKIYLSELENANLQLLDSLYYNLILNKKKEYLQLKTWNKPIKLGQKDQYLNQIGFKIIKQNKVALLIMAAGMNFRFGNQTKQTYKLQLLPSNKTPLEIILQRCDALGNLLEIKLDIIIMLSETKQQIQNFLDLRNFKNLKLKYVYQCQIGILDKNGKLVLMNEKKIYKNPNGTGDFLPTLQQSRLLEYLQSAKIEYLQIIGSNNLLQLTFDYRMLGYMKSHELDIIGKCINPLRHKKQQSKIIEINSKVYIIEPNEYKNYKQTQKNIQKYYNQSYSFINSMVFNTKFLTSILKNANWNHSFGRCYRCKKQILNCYNPYTNNYQQKQIYLFEKDFTDLLLFTQKYQILLAQRNQQYAPIIHKNNGQSNIYQAIIQLSNRNKDWLKLKNSTKKDICQISAYISIWGENLQEIIEELHHQQIKYPLYIHQQQ